MNAPWDMKERDKYFGEGCVAIEAQLAWQEGRFRPLPELSGYRMPVKNGKGKIMKTSSVY